MLKKDPAAHSRQELAPVTPINSLHSRHKIACRHEPDAEEYAPAKQGLHTEEVVAPAEAFPVKDIGHKKLVKLSWTDGLRFFD